MILLKLLSNKNFSILIIFFLIFFKNTLFANEPVDIWNIENSDQKKTILENNNVEENKENQISIYETNLEKKNPNVISEEKSFTDKETSIIGIYDPSENDLSINMWSYSDGQKITGLIIDPCFPSSPNPAFKAAGIIVIFPDMGPVKGSASQPNPLIQFAINLAP